MGILKILFIILLFIFSLGEVTRIQLANSIAVNFNDIAVFLFVATWIILKIIKKKKFKKPFLFLPILIFFTASIASLLFNFFWLSRSEFVTSVLYPLRWLMYAGIYFAFNDFDKHFKIKSVNYLLIPVGLIVVFGYIQFIFYQNLRNLFYLGWDEHLYRMFSVFLDPNFAGVFFALAFVFLLGMVFRISNFKKIPSVLLVILMFLDFLAVYLTYSRTALLALILGTLTIFYFKTKRRYLILIVMLLLLFVFVVPRAFKTEGTNLFRTVSVDERIKSAQIAISIFENNPVFGVGFDSYRYYQNRRGFISGSQWEVSHAGSGTDNSYLLILATTGIIGFIAYVYLLYKMFLLGKLAEKNTKLMLFSSLIVFCVGALFVNALFYTFLIEWVWILLAITEKN